MASLSELLAGIASTRRTTETEVAGAAEHLPKAIDVLLDMPRFGLGGNTPPSHAQMFRYWAINVYVNAAHTCWALYDLWRGGLYHEATILLRNLTEVLVQLRYFETRMSRVGLLLDEKTVRSFRFKDMFEAVTPGYYDPWYGLLSVSPRRAPFERQRLASAHSDTEPSLLRRSSQCPTARSSVA